MTVKDWLSRAKFIDKEIAELQQEQEKALARVTSITAAPAAERVQTTPQNTTEARLISYVDYSKTITDRISKLYEIKKEILTEIAAVENPTLRTLLTLRYINNRTFEEIAVEMDYSYVHVVHRLHPRALKEISKKLKM